MYLQIVLMVIYAKVKLYSYIIEILLILYIFTIQ